MCVCVCVCVCVCFQGGGCLNSSTTQQSTAEGGGVQPRFPGHKATGNRSGIFFCGTPPSRLWWAQTGHYMSNRHKTALLYRQETGNFTTYCDTTNPAPAVKNSLSALKLPKGEPAKRVANSAAPGIRRGLAIGFPDWISQAGSNNNLTSHPRTPLCRLAFNFRNVAIAHLALGCRLCIWTPFRIGMAFRGVGGLLLNSHGRPQNTENGGLSSRGGPESRRIYRITRAKRAK